MRFNAFWLSTEAATREKDAGSRFAAIA